MWVAVVLHMWTTVVPRMLSAVFDISVLCVVVLIIPTLIFGLLCVFFLMIGCIEILPLKSMTWTFSIYDLN